MCQRNENKLLCSSLCVFRIWLDHCVSCQENFFGIHVLKAPAACNKLWYVLLQYYICVCIRALRVHSHSIFFSISHTYTNHTDLKQKQQVQNIWCKSSVERSLFATPFYLCIAAKNPFSWKGLLFLVLSYESTPNMKESPSPSSKIPAHRPKNQQHEKRNSARKLNCINIYSTTTVSAGAKENDTEKVSRLLLNVNDDGRFESERKR